MKINYWSILALMLLAFPVMADEEEGEEQRPLTGRVTLGYLATTGNTETSSLNSAFEAAYKRSRWLHEATAAAINASENKQSTAEAYEAGWTSSWDISERDFVFGRLNWRKDRFGGFDTQFAQTVGYGRRVIVSDRHNLNLNVGAGARQSEDQVGVKDDEAIFTAGLDYVWTLSDTSEFRQDLRVESGSSNTFSESVTAITARLVGALNLTASYTIRNNSDVPIGTEKTDTRSAIALEYTF